MNNQYNYCFWKLLTLDKFSKDTEPKLAKQKVQAFLKDTVTKDKNEILFKEFGINYNNLPEIHKKGSFIYRKRKKSNETSTVHVDVIRDDFWVGKSWLLEEEVVLADARSSRSKKPKNEETELTELTS